MSQVYACRAAKRCTCTSIGMCPARPLTSRLRIRPAGLAACASNMKIPNCATCHIHAYVTCPTHEIGSSTNTRNQQKHHGNSIHTTNTDITRPRAIRVHAAVKSKKEQHPSDLHLSEGHNLHSRQRKRLTLCTCVHTLDLNPTAPTGMPCKQRNSRTCIHASSAH